MALLDDVLAANAAVVEGSDVPVPAVPPGRRVVVVACSEILRVAGRDLATWIGFAHAEAMIFANAGARVSSIDGDVVRSVASALAIADGGEVFVIAHEDCEFQESDPDSVASLLASPNSSMLQAVAALCGESFVSARKLAIASAETLRGSPYLPARTPVHALVFNEGRGRLAIEQRGYDVVATPGAAALFGSSSLGAAPSPILAAPGPSGFGAPGPVALFGSGPSSLMGAGPPASLSPTPDMGAAAASASFLAPPPPPAAPTTSIPGFVAPPAPPPPTNVPPPIPTLPPPLRFDEPKPRPAPARSSSDAADDPFKKAAETLERLRRARKR